MKRIFYLLLHISILCALAGCDEGNVPQNETPTPPEKEQASLIEDLKGGTHLVLDPGESRLLTPILKKGVKDVSYVWKEGEKILSTTPTYTFTAKGSGTHNLTLEVSDAQKKDLLPIQVTVTAEDDFKVTFAYPEQSATVGRMAVVSPILLSYEGVSFRWFVDNREVTDAQGSKLLLTPHREGTQTIRVIASKGKLQAEGTLTLKTLRPEQYNRRPSAASKATQTKVLEYLPAPGQLINASAQTPTAAEARNAALTYLAEKKPLSLGGFGGYIVVGFDHSIQNEGGYDFAIRGNSFRGSSEPGIVWVMQDENGNGLPDDNWYELRGSETGKAETFVDYEVTYYRPALPHKDVIWKDNRGNTGSIDVNEYHTQDSYYPQWVTGHKYTLRGTRLAPRTEDLSGKGTMWFNKEFDWGYADNFSPIDRLENSSGKTPVPGWNHFRISDAIDAKGQSVKLGYIDFIKVQTAVNVKAGWLGENSTEVLSFADIHLPK